MLFTQTVKIAWADGKETTVDLDQRDLIAAADAGAQMDTDDTIGMMRFLRAAAAAHLAREKKLDGDFDDLVIEVAPDVDDESEVNPTNPAT